MKKKIDTNSLKIKNIYPPLKSKNVLFDIWYFLLKKPKHTTRIKFKTIRDRLDFEHRILQRIGMDAGNYLVLNVHQLGINAPANHVFEELLNWNGDSTCWPNHIAKVDRINDRIENIQILPFGQNKYPFKLKNGLFGFKYIPLFNLNAQKIQSVPSPADDDNARYLLYNSSGGYPIGFFSMYVRSSIAELKEIEQSQIFFVVGFDFFGRKNWVIKHLIVKIWVLIHDRVTSNVMNRFKQLCEWRFAKTQKG